MVFELEFTEGEYTDFILFFGQSELLVRVSEIRLDLVTQLLRSLIHAESLIRIEDVCNHCYGEGRYCAVLSEDMYVSKSGWPITCVGFECYVRDNYRRACKALGSVSTRHINTIFN